MTINPSWHEIAWRLALTFVAGASIGLNRGEHGPAGLRTTILVCLAASVSMIQANLLLGTVGKEHESFAVLDLMRLPLGILSGMGFIGGGVILKKGDLVLGVTTAATLWFVTVMGLCFGGGQIELGLVLLVLGLFVLWFLKKVEHRLPQDSRGFLCLGMEMETALEEQIRGRLRLEGFKLASWEVSYDKTTSSCELRCELKWRSYGADKQPPKLLAELTAIEHIRSVKWQTPGGASDLE